jgi:hypothetical protein
LSLFVSWAYETLASWKWVLGYTALLLLSLNQTRRFLDWLEQRNLSGLQGVFLLLAAAGCVSFLLCRIRRTQGRFGLSTWLRLVGFLGLYLVCMFASTTYTVDRIHFVEYGILGLLCFHAVRPGHGVIRRVAYAMTALFAIAFLDECIQGFLATRYYALRDLTIDLLAGFLPALGLHWLPLYPREQYETAGTIRTEPVPKQEESSPRCCAADACALLLVLFLILGVLWVGRVPSDLDPLYGVWERENRCRRIERVRIDRHGTLRWEDDAGGIAEGLYRISGNRLDGPLLEVKVLEAQGEGPCAWRTGERRDRYFEVDTGSLVFKKEREFPFRRIDPSTSSLS